MCFSGIRIKGKNQKVNGNKSKGHLQYIKLARKMVIQLWNRFNGCGIVFSTSMYMGLLRWVLHTLNRVNIHMR